METTNQQQEKFGKWNNLIIIIPSLLFSLLFYQQNIGINFLLFSIITIILLAIQNHKWFSKSDILLKSVAFFITGVAIFLYHSTLTIITNLLLFFTLVGSFHEKKSSLYINWINGIYTTLVAVFTLYFEKLHTETKNIKRKKTNYFYWIKIIGIPLIIVLIFVNLYKTGNPKFDALLSRINFSFTNFQWMLFTGLGYYLFYNITHPITIEPTTSLDFQTKNELKKESLEFINIKKIKSEIHLGVVLLVALNILIVLFLVTDVLYLSEIHQMSAPQLSEQVHTGVNALIISIVLAIAIILYFFRGNINFSESNTILKKLTFIWIFLNLLMICITAIKNIEYLHSFGLTYKRIGVVFFLLFTAIGLITTYVKVIKIKNLWFLFRKNLQIAFAVLIISCTLNWDKIITFYNINYAEQLDLNYLIDLSHNNTFLLKDYVEKHKITNQLAVKINIKHKNYLRDLKNNSWQEFVFDNFKIQ
ncbi:DUF4153 domain-containing protein [Polaribacter sp.]|uniref:DUF4153 domain-containing protein n=1 Tax=Polaribacter sp. TaxID=1920175 RepID=UPI003F6C9A79